ncbi:hypothetical protein SERLA73DRAFT_94716 [Serpula lacrymans var. lacrymans S7.3]|uniref:Methyltransferase domain-containing protein n=2 Tax=Serpula lacrymans var. lacrymans TaxID=341189 RepID=F8Q731_SERL3|nr:uncharacterized protein SERLADRAFT_363113 [Serpula lacrymans var. lacrymans S7.9]EGN95369.1 hypothetical protein SERLA73DRAFT_94716 [Serpula lacrymans var. lacrymans S7.3]EGO20903.1 hypothetical protein SERLADRAFT_363113 [Serpula lacrymans var. lacrymans S7.9]
MSSKDVIRAAVLDDPQSHEDVHVHAIYDKIATHFSSTRYKPWPIVAQFLSGLPTGWIGLDSGTGNGKYLPLPYDRPGSVLTIGLDRSRNLLHIARTAGQNPSPTREVVWGDVLGNGWRSGAFDYAISIATIHHLASYERRQIAVERLLECVSPSHGRILIYVWAIEQDQLSKRNVPLDHEALSESTEPIVGQDVFVPWAMTPQNVKAKITSNSKLQAGSSDSSDGPETCPPPVYNRYYHMFAKGELTMLVRDAAKALKIEVGVPEEYTEPGTRGITVTQDGWERSNYYVELRCWEI